MFIECSTQLTERDLNDVEAKLGFTLPQQLKEHYLKFNGGIPAKPCFYAENIGIETRISAFNPIKYDDGPGLIEEIYVSLTDRNIISKKYLPFAEDGGGNFFCIDLENESIVLIWMDLGEVTEECINLLANSFSEFINNLEECEDDDY